MTRSDAPRSGVRPLAGARGAAVEALRRLHGEIDAEAAAVAQNHADRLRCGRGCADCCVDDLEVFEVEASNIRLAHAELLANEKPHPPGACAFLDANRCCRIYRERPYVCRTQGLPLRWFEDPGERGQAIERRDICPLNLEGVPLENLSDDSCWTLGPVEARLAALQDRFDPDRRTRVRLRDLFRRRD